MRTQHSPQGRRLAAVMCADIVGYHALSTADAAQARRLLDEHFELVRSVVLHYRGRVVKTTADEFLIAFDHALAALDCAIAVQNRHAERNRTAPPGTRYEIRIGIHLSEVEHRGSGTLGEGANVAARVEHLAPPGGIAISADIHGLVRGALAQQFRALGPQKLVNIAAPLEVLVLDPAALPPVSHQRPAAWQRYLWLIAATVAGAILAIVAFR